ncbi:MAG: hypothetical protein D084_Lepto4C00444G0001 [Leptospirillum sp. Group IV 'UBA BS']|nr:MAG: hypothetical protein D084_Lepto4C00444G0001 [Leptospirillum sp. Group IV 'UBA BS']
MGIFDMLKNESGHPATANSAVIATERPESEGITAKTAITATATHPNEETEIPPEADQSDPVSLAERIGIRFESEIPTPEGTGGLGKPVFTYRGHVLAWEADPPHVKFYAWCTVNLFPGRPLSIDTEPVGRLLGLTPAQVREAIIRLVREGDLVRTRERGGELFRLNVQYAEGSER